MTQNLKPLALSLEVQELESHSRAGYHTTARTCTCTVLACRAPEAEILRGAERATAKP